MKIFIFLLALASAEVFCWLVFGFSWGRAATTALCFVAGYFTTDLIAWMRGKL